jgi:hypothetical protein
MQRESRISRINGLQSAIAEFWDLGIAKICLKLSEALSFRPLGSGRRPCRDGIQITKFRNHKILNLDPATPKTIGSRCSFLFLPGEEKQEYCIG